MSGRGREFHPEFMGGVVRPTHRSRIGREAHPEVREESGGPPGGPGGIGRTTRWFERGREALLRSGWGRDAHRKVP